MEELDARDRRCWPRTGPTRSRGRCARPTAPPRSAPRRRVGAVSRSRLSNATTSAGQRSRERRRWRAGRPEAGGAARPHTRPRDEKTRASANQAMQDPRYEGRPTVTRPPTCQVIAASRPDVNACRATVRPGERVERLADRADADQLAVADAAQRSDGIDVRLGHDAAGEIPSARPRGPAAPPA